MHVWKTLKVFISSTFKDLELERDGLAQVFKRLQSKLFAQRLHLILYDLRWQDRNDHDDLVQWCIDMLNQCQYFVGILGYRYGWRPPHDQHGNSNTAEFSITEMEIEHALQNIPREKRFFFFGETSQYTKEQLASETQQDIQSLEKLKQRLQENGETIFSYSSGDQVLETIEQRLLEIFAVDYPKNSKVELEKYSLQDAIREIIEEKRRGFVGRNQYLQAIANFIRDDSQENNILVIHAVAGTGKSSLLAQFFHAHSTEYATVCHYVSTPGVSKTEEGIIASLYSQLTPILQLQDCATEQKPRMLQEALKSYQQRLVIFIDGIDEAETFKLSWLPSDIPNSLRLVFTTRPVAILEDLQESYNIIQWELPPLQSDEIADIIKYYQDSKKLSLSPDDQQLLAKRAAGNPLFLKVALDQLGMGGIAVGQLAETVDALFHQILSRLEKIYGENIVWSYLGLIAASRDGIVEAELLEILKSHSISDHLLMKLHRELANFVILRERLYSFFHPEFERSIKMLLGKSGMRKYHSLLADYLHQKGVTYEHALFSLPYQLQWSEQYERLLQLLTNLEFLQQKAVLGMFSDLKRDFFRALDEIAVAMPENITTTQNGVVVSSKTVKLLHQALEIDGQFISNNPHSLFQSLWNRCYWHDSPEAQHHYQSTSVETPWNNNSEDAIHKLMLKWQQSYENNGGIWLKSRRPFMERLESSLLKVFRHGDRVTEICHLPQSDRLLSSCGDGKARLWDIKTGELIFAISVQDFLSFVAVNSEETMFLACGHDNNVYLYQISSKKCLRSFVGHSDWVRRVSFFNNDKNFVSVSKDKTLRIWDVDTGECIKVLSGHKSCVNSVAIVSTGDKIVSGADDKNICVWDVNSGACLKTFKQHSGTIRSIQITQDDNQILTGSDDRTIKLLDIKSGNVIFDLQHQAAVLRCAFSQNQRYIISAGGSRDAVIKIWDVATQECIRTIAGHENSVESVKFLSEHLIVSSSKDNTARIWDLQSDSDSLKLHNHTKRLRSIAATSQNIVSGGNDGIVKLWNTKDACWNHDFLGHTAPIVSVYAQENIALSTSEDNTIRVWDIENKKCRAVLEGHENKVNRLSFNADVSLVASSSHDKTVRIWDVATQKCLKVLEGHSEIVGHLHLMPDERTIISASKDSTLRIWDIKENTVKVCAGHSEPIWSLEVDDQNHRAISGARDGTARVWDIKTGECLLVLTGHTKNVWSVAIKGDCVITGSNDNTIRFWNLQTGKCERILEGICNVPDLLQNLPYRAVTKDFKTVVETTDNRMIAAFPVALNTILFSADYIYGRMYNQLYVLELRGVKL